MSKFSPGVSYFESILTNHSTWIMILGNPNEVQTTIRPASLWFLFAQSFDRLETVVENNLSNVLCGGI